MDDVLPPVRYPIQHQQSIGWDQLYQGRIARTWAQAINRIHPTRQSAGEQVMTHLQRVIWHYILDTWALPNQHLHRTANTMNVPDFQQATRNLYEQRDQLNPEAQEALYRQPLEQILELPAPRLKNWVIQGHKYYNQQLKAAKKQAKLHTADIRTFF